MSSAICLSEATPAIQEPVTIVESPADSAAFLLHIERQMQLVRRQHQQDRTFYLPCLTPKDLLVYDPTRMIAAFVLFSHSHIFRLCPKTHVWVEGEFCHTIYRIDGVKEEAKQVFRFRHQRQRTGGNLLSAYDILQHISLKILTNGQLKITDDHGYVLVK